MSKKKARKGKVTRESLTKKLDKALSALATMQTKQQQLVEAASAHIAALRDQIAALPADVPPAATKA